MSEFHQIIPTLDDERFNRILNNYTLTHGVEHAAVQLFVALAESIVREHATNTAVSINEEYLASSQRHAVRSFALGATNNYRDTVYMLARLTIKRYNDTLYAPSLSTKD